MCKVHLWCHVIHLGADVFLNKGIFFLRGERKETWCRVSARRWRIFLLLSRLLLLLSQQHDSETTLSSSCSIHNPPWTTCCLTVLNFFIYLIDLYVYIFYVVFAFAFSYCSLCHFCRPSWVEVDPGGWHSCTGRPQLCDCSARSGGVSASRTRFNGTPTDLPES